MKPGDLITGKKYKNDIVLILDEYHEKCGGGTLPPFRVFRMLHSDGLIDDFGAENIERYWEIINETR